MPVIVGANDFDLALSPGQTKEALFAQFGPLTARARQLYDPASSTSFKNVMQAAISDKGMNEPSRHLAELVAKSGQGAYYYRFSYVAEAERSKTPGATTARKSSTPSTASVP